MTEKRDNLLSILETHKESMPDQAYKQLIEALGEMKTDEHKICTVRVRFTIIDEDHDDDVETDQSVHRWQVKLHNLSFLTLARINPRFAKIGEDVRIDHIRTIDGKRWLEHFVNESLGYEENNVRLNIHNLCTIVNVE